MSCKCKFLYIMPVRRDQWRLREVSGQSERNKEANWARCANMAALTIPWPDIRNYLNILSTT